MATRCTTWDTTPTIPLRALPTPPSPLRAILEFRRVHLYTWQTTTGSTNLATLARKTAYSFPAIGWHLYNARAPLTVELKPEIPFPFPFSHQTALNLNPWSSRTQIHAGIRVLVPKQSQIPEFRFPIIVIRRLSPGIEIWYWLFESQNWKVSRQPKERRMSWLGKLGFIKRISNSNSNHFITCLLIFILHYSPQLRLSLLKTFEKKALDPLLLSGLNFNPNLNCNLNSNLNNHGVWRQE